MQEVEGRRKRARRSVAAMIERYRREVEQRRNAILQSVGMPISAKDIPRDRVDESLFREAEELLEVRAPRGCQVSRLRRVCWCSVFQRMR